MVIYRDDNYGNLLSILSIWLFCLETVNYYLQHIEEYVHRLLRTRQQTTLPQ